MSLILVPSISPRYNNSLLAMRWRWVNYESPSPLIVNHLQHQNDNITAVSKINDFIFRANVAAETFAFMAIDIAAVNSLPVFQG